MSNVFQKLINFLREHKLKRRWHKALICLSAVVVFCTVYALILPAITLEATCGMQEHTHTDACYEIKTNSNREMACTLEVHSHTEECTDAQGNIICGKSDFVIHKHADDCYKDGLLICTLPEVTAHEHSEDCNDENGSNVCGKEELILHTHSDACYDETGALICEKEEFNVHAHSEACYDEAGALVCDKTELIEHVHTDDCFKVTDEPAEKILICGKTEHTHVEDCYPKVVKSTKTATSNETTTEETIEKETQSIATMSLEAMEGTTGTINWALTPNADGETYTLTLSGTGAIPNNLLYSSSVVSNLYNQKSKITKVVINEGITSIGTYAFASCEGLEEVFIPSSVTSIEHDAFYNSKSLKTVNFAENSKLEKLDNYAFQNCLSLTEITIPASVKTIGNYAFSGCTSLVTVNFEENSEVEKTIGSYAFQGCKSLTEITLPSTLTSIGTYAFYNCTALQTVNMTGSNAFEKTIGNYTFQNCSSLKEITLPYDLVGIGAYLFRDCDALESIVYDCASLETVGLNLFYNSNATFVLTVGKSVDELNASFMNQAASKISGISFEGPNTLILPDMASCTKLPVALQRTSGECYVDAQGVIYKLNEDGTATVAYAPAYLTGEYVVPYGITAENGNSYAVTKIGSKAFYDIDGLTSLVFESPSSIVNIPTHAFSNLPNLSSVNGVRTLAGVEGLFANATFGMSAFYKTALTGESSKEGEIDGTISLGNENGAIIELVTNDRDLYTGERSLTSISISPVDNAVAEKKIIRLYVDFSTDDGGIYGYTAGQEYTFEDGSYTAYLYKSDIGNLYYWEFPMINSGETILINMELLYQSPSSAGGTAKIWTEIVDKDSENNLYPAGQYHELEWTTKRDPFDLTKTYAADSAKMVSDGENMYLNNMKFFIYMKRDTTDSLTNVGKDYMQTADFTDVIDLPENICWREGVLDAIKNGDVTIQESSSLDKIYVTVGDEQLFLGSMSSSHYADANVANFSVKVNENEQLVFCWTVKKDYGHTNNELYNFSGTLTFGDNVIEVEDISALQTGDTLSFDNTVEAVQHYTHSADNTVSAQATADFYCGAANLKMLKYASTNLGQTWTSTPAQIRIGSRQWYKISMSNTGVLPVTNLSYVEDTLDSIYFIQDEDLQAMFDEDENHRLSVTITDATLCDPISIEVLGTNGNVYTITDPIFVGNNTDYTTSATKEDDCENEIDGATLSLTWEDDVLTLTVDKGTGEAVQTYTIGPDGDYADVQKALDGIGYVVSPQTVYNVMWTFEDSFRVFAGQSLDLVVRSHMKSTYMLISQDMSYRYYRKNTVQKNSAYAYDDEKTQLASCSCQSGSYEANYDRGISSTYVYLDGISLKSGTTVEIGDVLKYYVYRHRYGDIEYEVEPIVEQFTGAQVLIVPKNENDACERAENEDWTVGAQTYTDSNGVEYYILNSAGTYTQVFMDTAQATWADKVVVEPITGGGLNTRIYRYADPESKYPYSYFLVDPDLAGYDNTTSAYTLSGKVWINDHETRRLYTSYYTTYVSSIVGDKSIITDDGMPTEEPLDHSIVSEGESVTYQISLKTVSGERKLYGTNLKDMLPLALNKYWTKTDGETQGNISVTYSDPTRVTNGDAWTVSTSSNTQQYIYWDDCEFDVSEEAMYIYVTLTFPSGDNWQKYVESYGSRYLENTLYVFDSKDKVTHLLKAPTEVVFQKGVYSTGVGREVSSASKDNFYSYKVFTTENSRQNYVNDTADSGLVLYYVTIANTGNTRLYFEHVQDVLPEGFSFVKFYDSSYPLRIPYDKDTSLCGGKDFSKLSISGISYLDGSIYSSVETIDGREKVTFRIQTHTHGSSSYVDYDEEYGKYYIPPKKGVQFAYYARTNGYDVTEDAANNIMAMPYFDYNGGGVQLNTEAEVTVSNAVTTSSTTYNITPNDGTRNLMDASQAEQAGMTVAEGQTQWISSDVTLYRDNTIKPGISKRVYSVIDADGKEGKSDKQISGATAAETIGWAITAANTGGTLMTDYTITDVMQKPYSFAAGSDSHEITYKIYDRSGTQIETISLGYISKTDDGKIYLNSGSKTYRAYNNSYSAYRESSTAVPKTELVLGQPVEIVYYEDRVESTTNPEQSKVEITLNIDDKGNEVLSLRFMDDRFAIPAGGKAELILYTAAPETDRNNKIYSNMGYLIPSQDFNSVEYGSPSTYNNKQAVSSIAYMTVSYGFFTSSKVTVAETADTSNAANSHDLRNYIAIATGEEEFTYTLSVTNFTDSSMDKFVIIDNLPEADPNSDLTPFGELRGSNLKVVLADNPGFTVKVIERDEDGKETGEVRVLDPSQYTIEYSYDTPAVFAYETDEEIKTILQNGYWNGTDSWSDEEKEKLIQGGYWDGTKDYWTDSYAAEDKDNIRSFKITILDNAGTLITAEDIINVTFNAKVADKVSETEEQVLESGMTAWNSFGYRYSLVGLNIDLESSPVSAGVRIAYIPKLVKELENSVGGSFTATQAETFRFIIHTGKMLSLNDNFTEAELAQALTSGNRIFTYVTVTVPVGANKSKEFVLKNCKEYTYTDGQWIATDADWIWDKDDSYTVVELPIENVDYSFGSIAGVARNSYNFAYEDGNNFVIDVTNIHRDWSIRVNKYSNKVDEEGNKPTLAGAIFGLYSPDANDLLSDAAYAELTNTVGKEIKKTVEYEGATYYLSATGTSDTDGIAQFDSLSLSNVQYVVAEIMAPSGYVLKEEATPVLLSSANESLAEIEVVNEVGYVLPHTGGIGRTPYIIVGMLTTGIAGYCIYKQAKRRRKEGMAS